MRCTRKSVNIIVDGTNRHNKRADSLKTSALVFMLFEYANFLKKDLQHDQNEYNAACYFCLALIFRAELVAMASQLFLSNKHLTKLQNCDIITIVMCFRSSAG